MSPVAARHVVMIAARLLSSWCWSTFDLTNTSSQSHNRCADRSATLRYCSNCFWSFSILNFFYFLVLTIQKSRRYSLLLVVFSAAFRSSNTKGRTKIGRPYLTHFSKTLILDHYITLLSPKQSPSITFSLILKVFSSSSYINTLRLCNSLQTAILCRK